MKEESKRKKVSTPALIYFIGIGCMIIYFILIIPISSVGHSGGEQVPLTMFAKGLEIFSWGFFIISIITSFIDKEWFKIFWPLNLVIFLMTGGLLFLSYI